MEREAWEIRRRKEKQRQYNRTYYDKKKQGRVKGDERKVSLTIRLPEYLVGIVHRLTMESIAKGTHPWKTTGDTVRAILILGLDQLRKSDDTVEDGWEIVRLGERLHKVGEQRRDAELASNRTIEEIKRMQAIGSTDSATQLYHDVMTSLHNMVPSLWRDWAIDRIHTAFPELKKAVATKPLPVVKLRPTREHKVYAARR